MPILSLAEPRPRERAAPGSYDDRGACDQSVGGCSVPAGSARRSPAACAHAPAGAGRRRTRSRGARRPGSCRRPSPWREGAAHLAQSRRSRCALLPRRAWLRSTPTPALPRSSAPRRAPRRVEALRWIRELIASGRARPDEIAVCATATEDRDDHMLVLAADAGLPLHFSHGVPALASREGQACAALADVLLNGLSQDRVRRLFGHAAGRSRGLDALPPRWAQGLRPGAALFELEQWRRALDEAHPHRRMASTCARCSCRFSRCLPEEPARQTRPGACCSGRGTGALGRGAAARAGGRARILAAGASSSRRPRPGRLRGLASGESSRSGPASLRPPARPDDAIVATAHRRRSAWFPAMSSRDALDFELVTEQDRRAMRSSPRRLAALWCSRGVAATPRAGCRPPVRRAAGPPHHGVETRAHPEPCLQRSRSPASAARRGGELAGVASG